MPRPARLWTAPVFCLVVLAAAAVTLVPARRLRADEAPAGAPAQDATAGAHERTGAQPHERTGAQPHERTGAQPHERTGAQAQAPTEAPPAGRPAGPPAVAPAAPEATSRERLGGASATFGEGLRATSDDGDWSLEVRGRVQLQAALVAPDDGGAALDFLARRARLTFRGKLGHEHVEYNVQLGLAPRDMEPDLLVPLRDAQIAWTGWRDLSIRAGVQKVPWSRERVMSSGTLQFVDRSIVNAELNLDRDNGVQLYSRDLFGWGRRLGYQLGVFGGNGRLRGNADLGLLYVARVEVTPFGAFEDALQQVDHLRSDAPRLAVGAGVAYNAGTPRERSTHGGFYRLGAFDYLHLQADVLLKVAGFSLHAEVLYRGARGARERTGTVDGETVVERARSGLGVVAQTGYLLGFAPLELSARYAEVWPLGSVTATARQREVLGAVSYYARAHDLKVQLDAGRLLDEIADAGGGRRWAGRWQVRLQTQMWF